jgi:hypothetical protein
MVIYYSIYQQKNAKNQKSLSDWKLKKQFITTGFSQVLSCLIVGKGVCGGGQAALN